MTSLAATAPVQTPATQRGMRWITVAVLDPKLINPASDSTCREESYV